MADDFFVRFGSNARVFSRELAAQLEPADAAVSQLGTKLQALEVTAAAKQVAVKKRLVEISDEATAVQAKLDAIGEHQGGGQQAELQAIARQAIQQVADVMSSVDQMSGKLETLVTRIGRAGEEFSKAQKSANQSAGQRNSEANQSRSRGPGGRQVEAGTPGAKPFYGPAAPTPQQLAAAVKAAQGSKPAATSEPVQTPVRIVDIPKATIDEASFARVVAVGEQQVDVLRGIETAVDRIAGALNGSRLFRGAGPGEGQAGAPVESQVEGLAKLTKQQNSELYRAFASTLKAVGNDAGPEKQQDLWKQLVANQQKALAAGTTIIPAGAADEAEPESSRVGRKRVEGLNKTLATLGERATVLRAEIEPLSAALEEARLGGRQAAGEAELLSRKLNELGEVEGKMASAQQAFTSEETRSEQRERQRRAAARAAAAQAGLTDTADERARKRNERSRLELATDPAALAALTGRGSDKLDKRGVQEIAETLTRQGYGVDLGSVRPETGLSRLSVDELIKRIGVAGQEYIAAGRATAEDLRPRRLEATSEIGPGATNLLAGSRVAEMTQRFTQELGRLGLSAEKAYRLIGLSMATGGDDPRNVTDARNVRGSDPDAYRPNAKTARGRLQVGAAIGDELRDELAEAGNVIDAFHREYRDAARSDVVGRLRQDQLFNPAAADTRVEGKGEEAQNARRQIAAILRATDELDDFARDLHGLDDQVKKTERAWFAVTRAIAEFESLERQPTQEETDAYSRNVPRQQQIEETRDRLRQELALKKSLYSDPQGGTADYLLEPGAREGLRRRDEYRVASRPDERTGKVTYQSIDSAYAEYENRAAPERAQQRAAVRAAVFEYLGRAKIFGTNEGNTRDYFSRALPGVRGGGSAGRERLEFIDEDKNRGEDGAKNRRALARMTAGMAGYSSGLYKLIELTTDEEATEEELTRARQKVTRALGKLLSGYQTAFPTAPVRDERLFLPPQLFGGESESSGALLDQSDQNVARQRRAAQAQAKRDQIESDAAEQFNDPQRAEKRRQERLKEVRSNIKKINEDLRDLTTEQKSLTAQQAAATKTLNRELGKSLRDQIATSEAVIAEVKGKGGKATDADRERRTKAQGRIDQAYGASPAIEEAKAARDAIIASKAEAAERRKALEAKRELGRQERKELQGRVDPSDLQAVYDGLESVGKKLARAEATLVQRTQEAARIREELAARELAIRARLPQDLQGQFDTATSERDRLESEAKSIRTGDALRGDRGEGALNPDAVKAADEAAKQLSELERQLGTVNGTLNQLERYSGALDPHLQKADPFADPALRPHNPRSGGTVNTEDIQTDGLRAALRHAEEGERRLGQQITELNRTVKAEQDRLRELIAAFRAMNDRRGSHALEEPSLPGFNDGGRGGDGLPPTAAGADEPSRNGPDILRQILAAINKVDATLKGGLKVTGRAAGAEKEKGATTGEKAVRVASDRDYQPRSTDQGRADFEQSIGETIPAVGQLLEASREVDAAAELVVRGVMSETAVLNLFRDRMKLTAAETKKFLGDVRGAVGNQRLAAAAQAAEAQRVKEESRTFVDRTGETSSIQQAKAAMREDLADRKRRSEALVKSQREEREAALATTAHARAMAQLSPATRHEVAELERMVEASKKGTVSQQQLAAQMAKVYGLAAQDLGARSTETNQTVGRIYKGAGLETSGGEVEAVRKEARGLGYQVDQTAAAGVSPGGLFGEQSKFTQALFGNHGFWSRIMNSTGTFVVRNFTAGFVFGMTAALQQVIVEAIQTEATFVRVSHALEATGRSAGGLRGDLQSISTDLGTNLNDVYKTAAGLTGLFKTPQEIAGATRVVSQLQLISSGALNAQEAMGTLASIQGAFGEELGSGIDGLTHVADVLTSVQNDIGTNVEVTAEGVGRMSGLAHQLGLSLEEVAVYSAQISKLTNQTGAAAGEQFSRILSVLQTGRGRSAVQEAFGTVNGKDTNIGALLSARDYSGVLKLMSKEWGNLTDAQRANVSVSVAGQRQAAAFAALMSNGAQSIDAIARAENSHGAAAERVDKIMQTLNGQVEKLGSNLQNVANNLIRSGVLNFILVILQATNGLLGAFNSVFSTINDFADASPLLSWLTDIGFGIVGLALAVTVLKRSFQGLKQSLRELPSVKNFKEGYQGNTAGGVGGAAARESRTERAVGRGLPITTRGVGDRDFGLSSNLGRLLDRTLIPPFNAAGNAATRLSQVLRDRAETIRTAGGAPGLGPLTQAQVERNQGRARRIDLASAGLGRVGGFFGAIGEGGREVFQGRGQQYFAGVSQRQAATQRLRQLAVGDLRTQAALESDPAASRQLRRQASVLSGLGTVAGAASRTTSVLSSSIGALAKAGPAADIALGAVALGVAAVTYAMSENARVGHQVENVLDERNKADRAKAGIDDPYKGPAQEEYDAYVKSKKDQNGLTTGFEFLGHAAVDAFTGSPNKVLTGETYDEMYGVTDGKITGLDDANKALDEAIKRIDDYAKQGRRDTGRAFIQLPGLKKFSIETVEGFTTPLEGITVAQKENAKVFHDMQDKVANNKDLSRQEALASLAAIEQAQQAATDMAEDRIAVAEGLSSSGLLELEQIKRISETISTLQALQADPAVLQTLKGGVSGLVSETGVDENNPEIQKYLISLQRGGVGAAEAAVGNSKIIAALAKQAEVKYTAALSTGETEQIDDARQELTSLMGQLAQATENNVQTFVQTATALSDSAFAQGNFAEGRAAIDQAIKDIEGQKPRGTTRTEPDGSRVTTFTDAENERRLAFAAQQRALVDKRTQSVIQERNAPLALAAAPGLGEVGNAKNQRAQAQNTLSTLREARVMYGSLGPTVQQINEAEIAVAQAQASVAQANLNKRLANKTALAAATWSQARQDNLASQQAALQLERAIELYGADSIEALQAMGALAQANKTKLENATQRRAARREAVTASIPQGNTVAVTQSQLSNAQAALADAERYGHNSTQYQGALQQLYSAQQAASAATSGIAVAQASLAQAYAQASGNAVAAAHAGVAVAQATLSAALQASGGAVTAETLGAQAQLVAANQAVQDAQVQLVQSRIAVTIALANAAGDTVRASRLQIQSALAALRGETPGTAEYNQARAEVINARAAARDAELQDKLDTIDFNLQMGRITSSAAIQALQQILRTSDLTKQQRRQLLLQIKGMKDELADSQWNFGDIKLPTPYQMRAYIAARREGFRNQLDAAATSFAGRPDRDPTQGPRRDDRSGGTTTIQHNRFEINGADTAKVKKIITEVVGGSSGTVTRTTGARRGRP